MIASLSQIGRCDRFCVGFITRTRKALWWNKWFFFPSFGHLRISDGFVLLHKKGAFGVQCSLNNGYLLILNRRGGRNVQKWIRFQPIRVTHIVFSCILLQADREWNFGLSYRRIHTDPQIVTGKANERFVSTPSAKKQRKHSTTSRVSPYISSVLQLLLVFVNVTHLILISTDSRLKLLSFETCVVLGQIEANCH